MADPRKLARIHRVRSLQLTLAQADEARALDKHASEASLSARIAQLAAAVAPAEASTHAGFSLSAAAHYRDRLQQSAAAAADRVQAAEQAAERAATATREAKRDQSAVEKLIARADAAEALRALRALEGAPAVRTVRHDPC